MQKVTKVVKSLIPGSFSKLKLSPKDSESRQLTSLSNLALTLRLTELRSTQKVFLRLEAVSFPTAIVSGSF